MTDHATLERIARQLCTDAGRDYDRKYAKREHWRKKAGRLLAEADTSGVVAWLRACGWRK